MLNAIITSIRLHREQDDGRVENPRMSNLQIAGIAAASVGIGALTWWLFREPSRPSPLPSPRPEGKPSPTPKSSDDVPATVKSAADTIAPAAPETTTQPTTQGEWIAYGWYTYQGNAPEKMWIRVDQRWSSYPSTIARPGMSYSDASGITTFRDLLRWTVVIGEDTPMATEIVRDLLVVCPRGSNLGDPGCPLDAVYATAAKMASDHAAQWIDLAYGG